MMPVDGTSPKLENNSLKNKTLKRPPSIRPILLHNSVTDLNKENVTELETLLVVLNGTGESYGPLCKFLNIKATQKDLKLQPVQLGPQQRPIFNFRLSAEMIKAPTKHKRRICCANKGRFYFWLFVELSAVLLVL